MTWTDFPHFSPEFRANHTVASLLTSSFQVRNTKKSFELHQFQNEPNFVVFCHTYSSHSPYTFWVGSLERTFCYDRLSSSVHGWNWLIQQKYWKLFWVMFLTRFGHNLKTDEHSFSNTPGSEFWILRNTFSLFRNHFDSFKISKISKKDF